MAINLNVIRNITVRGTTQGVDETTAKLNKLAGAQENVAQVSERSARASLSVERALERHQRQLDMTYRAEQQFARVQADLDRARAQGLIGQQRHSELLALAAARYDQVSRGQRAFIAASQAANDNIRTLSASVGALGSVLAALGPAGVAAAAGLGAAVLVFHQMIAAATNLAERAGKLKDFAETTGFSVIELQALEKAGAQVGVSSESVSRALERFSAQMADVRLQTGETYEKLLAINPALARQVAEATSLSRAYELVADAIKKANLEQGNQLARAIFGRGGVEQTRLLRAVAEAGGLKGLIAELHQADVITAKQAERWDELGDKIAENMKAAKQNIASIFTEDVLVGMERFSKAFLDLTRSVKEFSINDDLKKFIDFASSEAGRGALAGGLAGGMLGGPVGAAIGGLGGLAVGAAVGQMNANDVRELREELEKLQLARAGAATKLINTTDVDQIRELPGIIQRLDQRISTLKEKLPINLRPADKAPIGIEVTKAVDAAAKAQEELKRNTIASYNEMARWMGVIGNAATMAQKYELQTLKLQAAKAQGIITEEQYTQAIDDQKRRLEQQLGVADQAVMIEQRLAEVREVAAKAGLTDEQTRLALIIAEREARERANAAWARANPIMKDLLDMSAQFFESFLQGIASGKSGVDSLMGALKGLSNQLISMGSRSFMSGLQGAFSSGSGGGMQGFAAAGGPAGFLMMAAGMAMSFASQTRERRQQQQQQQQQRQIDTQRRIEELQQRSALVGVDQNTLSGALTAFDLQTQAQIRAAGGGGGSAKGFTLQSPELKLIEEVRARERLDLIKRFNDQEIEEEKRRQSELKKLRMDFADREFAAMNDTSTLQGQLLAFDRAAARERLELGEEFSSLMPDLERAQAAERLRIIRDFNAEAEEETRQFFDAFRKNIDTYLLNLRTGQGSPLSPADRFAQAQARYNAQLAIGSVAGPNQRSALEGITQDADRLLDAARALYGSSAGFQSIFTSVTSQLEALPDIAELADPIVAAIQAQTTALTTPLVNIKSSTDTVATNTDQTADNIGDSNSQGLRGLVDQLETLQQTSRDHLALMKDQLTFTGNTTFTYKEGKGAGASPQTVTILVQHKMLDALNLIVGNTWAISENTAISARVDNSGATAFQGNKALGGWITGGIAGRDSVPLAAGGLGMPGEFVVRRDVAQANRAWLPDFNQTGRAPITPGMPPQFAGNDNAAAAEIRALRAEVRELREELARNTRVTAAGAEHVGGQVAEVAGGMNELVRETKFAGQKKNKAA